MPGNQLVPRRKQLIIRLPSEIHRKIKILAAKEEKTITDMIFSWIDEKTKQLERLEQRHKGK